MERKFRLYVHIPFCMKKCLYCDFLSWKDSRENQERYIQALLKEIGACQGRYPYRVSSLFFGGGTPSVLEPGLMEGLMEGLTSVFSFEEHPEISIEANPGTVDREKLKAYVKMGLDRISFGLQSVHNRELKMLGRIHTYEEFLEGYELAREEGFENINVDLMSGLPGQDLNTWRQSLRQVAELEPEHISAYSLILEEGTPFYQMDLELPEEEEERRMYEETAQLLGHRGYQQYEISNYALPGRQCSHNVGYWTRDNYLGLGLGAASLMGDWRWNNTDSMEIYLEKSGEPSIIQVDKERLSVKEQMEETMFLGLRMTEGISRQVFFNTFGVSVEKVYGEKIRCLEELGLLQTDPERIRLTRRGISLSNQVFVEFLL